MNLDYIRAIIDKYDGARGGLISILEDIQAKYGYLPAEALKMVAEKTETSLVDVYGIATFYKLFRLKPRGKHLILACAGTACHLRDSSTTVEGFKTQLGTN